MAKKIKVLVVDDSAIVRSMLSENLSKNQNIDVVGTAPNPYIARDKILSLKPDVMTLDIEMPRMDGLTFLKKLMTYHPMPIIIVSSVTTNDKYAELKALELGAFAVVNKPGGSIDIEGVIEDISYQIEQAYEVKDSYIAKVESVKSVIGEKIDYDKNILSKVSTTEKLLVIGSSTGGTVALEFILKNLPASMPPILIVQHMPPTFTYNFAMRLNELSELNVKEAEDGELIKGGNVYIAKGDMHLGVRRSGVNLYLSFDNSEKVHFQKPAADVTFNYISDLLGKNAIGILLTGMGKDGAEGLLKMKKSGAYTLCQDESSSVVWGMPKAAIDLGAAREVVSLKDIPKKMVNLCT